MNSPVSGYPPKMLIQGQTIFFVKADSPRVCCFHISRLPSFSGLETAQVLQLNMGPSTWMIAIRADFISENERLEPESGWFCKGASFSKGGHLQIPCFFFLGVQWILQAQPRTFLVYSRILPLGSVTATNQPIPATMLYDSFRLSFHHGISSSNPSSSFVANPLQAHHSGRTASPPLPYCGQVHMAVRGWHCCLG